MPIPAGVTVRSSSSSPKLATTPVIDTAAGKITWNLGHVQAGKKVKVSIKLVATNCTTPAALPLNGKFAYVDATGAKTVDACLKKPVGACAHILSITGTHVPIRTSAFSSTPLAHRRNPATAVRLGEGLR